MPSLRVRLIDRNRYAKRYPFVRAPTRYTYLGDSDFSVEVGSIYFNNVNSGSLTFDAPFSDSNYQIFAIARQTDSETANVNIFVTQKSQTSVTVQSSSIFTGYVDVFAVRVA